jgi:hypothetical protein
MLEAKDPAHASGLSGKALSGERLYALARAVSLM